MLVIVTFHNFIIITIKHIHIHIILSASYALELSDAFFYLKLFPALQFFI